MRVTSLLVSHHKFAEWVDAYFATVEEWPAVDGFPPMLHAVIGPDRIPMCAMAPRAEQPRAAA